MTARRAGFSGDSRGLTITALLLAVAVSAALFAISYQGLAHAGEDLGLGDWSWVVPVGFDGGILVAGGMAAVRRGQKRRNPLELTILWSCTVASCAANVTAHTVRGDGVLAVGVGALAPWLFLALTESIIRTVIQDEVAERPKRTRAPRAVVAPAPVEAVAVPAAVPAVVDRPAPKRTPAPLPVAPSGDLADLLARFDALAADDRSSEPRSEESAALTSIIYELVDTHGQGPTALARRAGHANADRIKDRLRRARRSAIADAA